MIYALATQTTGEIERRLHADESLANVVIPSRRTIYTIRQEALAAAALASSGDAWSFFDDDMPPEDARLVMDYYAGVPTLRGRGRPFPIDKLVARRYVRIRRAYPELPVPVAMGMARMADQDATDVTQALIGEARTALEER
jgi:hypothetical protein